MLRVALIGLASLQQNLSSQECLPQGVVSLPRQKIQTSIKNIFKPTRIIKSFKQQRHISPSPVLLPRPSKAGGSRRRRRRQVFGSPLLKPWLKPSLEWQLGIAEGWKLLTVGAGKSSAAAPVFGSNLGGSIGAAWLPGCLVGGSEEQAPRDTGGISQAGDGGKEGQEGAPTSPPGWQSSSWLSLARIRSPAQATGERCGTKLGKGRE